MGTHGEGEMAALTVDLESARPLSDKHYCGIAGLNLPDQTVVGGSPADLDALAAEMAEVYPKKRAVRLKTEGAFHTYYMVTAARHFREDLERVEIKAPQLQVLSNYTGGLHEADAGTIKSRLFFQLFHPGQLGRLSADALDKGINLLSSLAVASAAVKGRRRNAPTWRG